MEVSRSVKHNNALPTTDLLVLRFLRASQTEESSTFSMGFNGVTSLSPPFTEDPVSLRPISLDINALGDGATFMSSCPESFTFFRRAVSGKCEEVDGKCDRQDSVPSLVVGISFWRTFPTGLRVDLNSSTALPYFTFSLAVNHRH